MKNGLLAELSPKGLLKVRIGVTPSFEIFMLS